MPKEPLYPKGAPKPLAPYSPGVKANNVVYVSGVTAMDSSGNTVGIGDAGEQTRCVLEAVKATLEAAGGTLADVTMNSIFLKDLKDYKAMNLVYAEYFPDPPPARYCIQAELVRPDFLVEIATIAHL